MSANQSLQQQMFVDAHVHIKNAEALSAVLQAGVGIVRDAGSRERAADGVVIRPGSGETGPLIVSAGWAIFKPGGYGSVFGIAVDGPDRIRTEIIRLATAGAAIIKVMASGMVSLRNPGTVTPGGFSEEELAFIVRESFTAGLGVMAHANGERAIIAAARAGVRSIEHGFFMTRAALEIMAAKGVYWTPTVGALVRAADEAGISAEAKKFADRLVTLHLQMIGNAYELGVPLAIGTDCVLPRNDYNAVYRNELAYFEQAGIPGSEVLRIAAEGGAKLVLPDGRHGRKHQR